MPKMLWGVFGLVFAMAVVAQGTYAAEMGMADELKTAITHAGFAEKYDSMKEVSLHLHHVVNCLVGEGDPMFERPRETRARVRARGLCRISRLRRARIRSIRWPGGSPTWAATR